MTPRAERSPHEDPFENLLLENPLEKKPARA